MKLRRISWSRRYRAALRRHMKHGTPASLSPALALGRQAVGLKLETLDVAGIHKQELASMKPVSGSSSTGSSENGTIRRAKRFFNESIVPIEKSHPAARKTDVRVRQLTRTLRARTTASKKSTTRLKQGIADRKAAEVILKTSGKARVKLLRDSDRLQKRLRSHTHEELTKQENKRLNVSRRLHDEIAQTLVAINLRLLALNKTATEGKENLVSEFAATRRVVTHSVSKILAMAKRLRVIS